MSTFRHRARTTCRICGDDHLVEYLDLGNQPPSNSFIEPKDMLAEQCFPLKVNLCVECGLSQLSHIVFSEDIFDDYAYLSSSSKALCVHYQELVNEFLEILSPPDDSMMVDIGCNDGILLRCFPRDRFRLLGVEPSSAGQFARESGFEVIDTFFDQETGRKIQKTHGSANIITATNIFAHVDDISSFMRGINMLLADDGVFIIEFPYIGDMLEKLYFDTIYHEHLSYFALTPLKRLFDFTGFRAFHAVSTEIGASGPAVQLYICREDAPYETRDSVISLLDEEKRWGVNDAETYYVFSRRVAELRLNILSIIASVRKEGGKIGAFGAPAKGNTLLNYLGLGPEDIVAVAENNEIKVGKVTPGSHISIVNDQDFLSKGLTHALLLTWNYADFFLSNAEFVKRGGKFIIPLPEPRISP